MSDPVHLLRPRSAGLLLHPTSLPGPYGIGDLGSAAYRWIDALAYARQKWWQILPLNPVGYGNSPYQSFACFAGNFYLVSPEQLVQEGLLQSSDLPRPDFHPDRSNYQGAMQYKDRLLHRAYENFKAGAASGLRQAFEGFQHKQQRWLHDYTLFRALKDVQENKPWYEWPRDLLERQPAALERARQELQDAIHYYEFVQFLFDRQWSNVKSYANQRGIRIFGDVPIFVALDSMDVWANSQLFLLNERRQPTVVAGVPPDYFSSTGQLWGNPLYDWNKIKQTGFQWWLDRLMTTLQHVDMVRLDHFRGFESYWEVPAGMPTAEVGKWVKAPGADLFHKLRDVLGGLPLVAEDLGIITAEVDALRRQFDLPGMCVLQFAFGGGNDNPYLPHNYDHNTVVYTGTHDNNTTRGWYNLAPEREKDHVRRYLGRDGKDIAWDLIRIAWSSVGDIAIAPLQDLLDLGNEARMNFPGRGDGNWEWRYREEMLTRQHLDRLGELTELFRRL